MSVKNHYLGTFWHNIIAVFMLHKIAENLIVLFFGKIKIKNTNLKKLDMEVEDQEFKITYSFETVIKIEANTMLNRIMKKKQKNGKLVKTNRGMGRLATESDISATLAQHCITQATIQRKIRMSSRPV